ncbi:MAG: hypothetical protein ACOH2J_21600 [Allorhizobium sp.]
MAEDFIGAAASAICNDKRKMARFDQIGQGRQCRRREKPLAPTIVGKVFPCANRKSPETGLFQRLGRYIQYGDTP